MTYVALISNPAGLTPMVFAAKHDASQYGNGFAIYANTEELLADENVTTQMMVGIYNALADKPVNKFSDRKTAAQRTWAIIQAQVPVTTPNGRTTTMDTNTQTNDAGNSGSPLLDQMKAAGEAQMTAAQQKAAEKEAARAAKKAEAETKAQERAAKKAETDKSKAEAKAARDAERAKKAEEKAAAKAAAGGSKGRVSSLSGKLLKHSVGKDADGIVKNPRREGSHGHRSMQIILDAGDAGITTEDFVKAGGRMNDLHWDIDHGNVAATDAPTA